MTDQRVGLIGYGMRASLAEEAHRPGEGSRVVAVCDVRADRRAQAQRDYPEAVVVDDIDALLGLGLGLDSAMVFTPDAVHASGVIAALEAGLSVFCEKPMAISVEDCDRMLEAAHRTRSRLYVGHNMRHMPVVTLMHDIIAAGVIGEVKAIWCRHFVGHGGDYYFKDWHADRSRSLGLLLQKGVHDLDVIHWLAGAPPAQVQAMGTLAVYGDNSDRHDRVGELASDWFSLNNWPPEEQSALNPVIDVEDLSQVNLRLTNGVLASYAQCHFSPDYWRNYTVIGTRGRLENLGDTPGSEIAAWTRRIEASGPPDRTWVVPQAPGGHNGADALMIDEFLRFATEGASTISTPVAARDAVAAGVAATRSLRSDGGTIQITPVDPVIAQYFAANQAG
ncbi:Gfo/Idh/MocA family protein [Tessaracoccus sp.]